MSVGDIPVQIEIGRQATAGFLAVATSIMLLGWAKLFVLCPRYDQDLEDDHLQDLFIALLILGVGFFITTEVEQGAVILVSICSFIALYIKMPLEGARARPYIAVAMLAAAMTMTYLTAYLAGGATHVGAITVLIEWLS